MQRSWTSILFILKGLSMLVDVVNECATRDNIEIIKYLKIPMFSDMFSGPLVVFETPIVLEWITNFC